MWDACNWRHGTLLGLVGVGLVVPLFLERIPQDALYHNFSDSRSFLGLPNFFNVMSNVLFVVMGLAGFMASRSDKCVLESTDMIMAYKVFFVGVALIGVGSAYYHLYPNNVTLVWDRLPMTVSFMALLAMVIGDCVSPQIGKVLLWPLIGIGMASIGYWSVTELWGVGDLRPYGVVQFLPMVLIPLMLSLFGTRSMRSPFLWAMLGAYLLAKVVEHFDATIYSMTGFMSGHSLKHIIAALATAFVILACQKTELKI